MDVFQGKRGSKIKIDIAKFKLINDFVLVLEGAPSYTDVQALFGSLPPPGCPLPRNLPKKNKKQLKKSAEKMLNKLRQNAMLFGFEFIAVSLILQKSHNLYTKIILLRSCSRALLALSMASPPLPQW